MLVASDLDIDVVVVASGTSAAESDADDSLLSNWLDTVNKKNRLLRREAELNFL